MNLKNNLYATFNMDFKRPLFSNFMDGSNGWFRAGYENRDGFGYGPWDMSLSVLTGGYGFWSVYNPDVEAVFRALLEMIHSAAKPQPKRVSPQSAQSLTQRTQRKTYKKNVFTR